MPFVPVPATIRVVVVQNLFGFPVLNTFDVHDSDVVFDSSEAAMTGLAQDVWNNWRDHVMPWLGANLKLRSVETQDQGEEDGTQGLYTAAEIAGGQAGQPFPANVTIVCRKRTARAGRNFAGRLHLAGVTENIWDGASVDAGVITGLNAGFASLLDGIEDGTRSPGEGQRRMCVASRFDGKEVVDGKEQPKPRVVGEWAEVTSLIASNKVGTLRNRHHRG